MAKSKKSAHLENLFKVLKQDWESPFHKYPDTALFSLADPRVTAAIETRFAREAGIAAIRALPFDFLTGLNTLCFEFAASAKGLGPALSDAFLVVLDAQCKVVGLIDPFDPVQPSRYVPPLPAGTGLEAEARSDAGTDAGIGAGGEQPFVLARPSATHTLTFSDQELYPVQVRSRAFFKRLTAGGHGLVVGDDIFINATMCDYFTSTPQDNRSDRSSDDCAEAPILA